MISRYGLRVVPPTCEGSRFLWEITRFVHAVVHCGSEIWHACSYYGYTNAWQCPEARELNERLMKTAFRYIASLGSVPLILGVISTLTPHTQLASVTI